MRFNRPTTGHLDPITGYHKDPGTITPEGNTIVTGKRSNAEYIHLYSRWGLHDLQKKVSGSIDSAMGHIRKSVDWDSF